ncbi:MAG: type II secretion system protein GspF, partial [Methylovulum miyakonense]
MPAFEYQAVNAKGQTQKGVFESDTVKLARQQLRSQGLTLLELHEVQKKEHKARSSFFAPRISLRQM